MPVSGNLVRYERYRKGPRTPRSAHARYYYTRSLVLDSPAKRRQHAAASRSRRCQSAPKVMDSHSRSASPREPMRPQHRPPSPPASPGAFDNRAYQHDDADPNHNDSFTSNGPQQNGHSKEPNGDTKLPEAVNLELINLTPKNGSKKKEVEVDMNGSNPYDEYFVPVNEHRKFMRGEKLYVTADKRGEKGGCKRPLCWTLLVLVVAAIVAIIVLAATGVLFSSSPTSLEPYNTSISSARALNGLTGHVHSHDHDHDHDHDHEHDHDHSHITEPALTQHGPEAQNDEPIHAIESDENDMSLYVPRTVEGQLKIDNEEFTPALEDPESPEYREFVSTFTAGLKRALFDRNTLENGDNDVIVEVVQISKGSVVVTYRIHWKPKFNAETTVDLLNSTSLKTKLDNYLANNNRMINVYHVSEDMTPTKHVLDVCQMDNNHCEHGCEFDETTLEFTCTCPHGQILDVTNPKKCISILENAYPKEPNQNTEQKEIKLVETEMHPNTIKPAPEEEKPNTESVHVSSNENMFDWKEAHHMIPETTTENHTDLNLSHIFGHGNEHDNEAPAPEPTKSDASPEPTAEPKAEPEPTAEPKPEPEPNAEPEPASEPKPEPIPAAEPNPEPEPAAEPKPEPEPAAEPKPKPEPAAEPKAVPEPTAEPKVEPEPTAEPKTEPTSEPVAESEPSAKAAALHEPAPEPTAEPAAEPSPEPEPKSEPQPSTEHTSSEHNSGQEVIQTVLTTTDSVPLPKFVPKSEPEPTSEPKAEPIPTSGPEVHQMIDQENHPTTSQHEVVTVEPESVRSGGTGLELEHQYDRKENPEEKSTFTIGQGSYDWKSDDNMYPTTMRVSISEPNIINEPSYEPKPEIISILSDKKEIESRPKFVTEDNSELTTERIDEWLQFQSQNDMKKPIIFENNVHKDQNDSEQRSFKSVDIFAEDATTAKIEEQETSTGSISEEDKSLATENNKSINEDITTASINAADNNEKTERTMIDTESSFDTAKHIDDKTKSVLPIAESPLMTVINEGQSLDSNENTSSIVAPESDMQHSISELNNNSNYDIENKLLEALEKRNETKIEIATETFTPEEGMDITFDTINMLYNRSSKSIENQNASMPEATETAFIETTTDSEWLSEPFSEMKYEVAMNNVEKQKTTESSITNIDDIINSGTTKDDFEPDYLNNMSSNNNKMSEQDEPLYGMVHDYDGDDSRVKRVNEESNVTTDMKITGSNSKTTLKPNLTINSTSSSSIETTTLIDYIYKTAQKTIHETVTPVSVPDNMEVISLTTTSSTDRSEPAPVWEESDAEKDLTVKELVKPVHIEKESETTHMVSVEDIAASTASTTTTSTTAIPITVTFTSEPMPALTTSSNIQEIPKSESEPESQTQVNNLNVTIYEISSHNSNNSFAVTNQHSGEFEDHETEMMNPFLPEVENNKSLVKKLQEGHDIEPTSFNETQNENTEDNTNTTLETATRILATNDNFIVPAKSDKVEVPTMATPSTPEIYSFNELMKDNSQENKTEDKESVTTTVEPVENTEEEKTEEVEELIPTNTEPVENTEEEKTEEAKELIPTNTEPIENNEEEKTDSKAAEPISTFLLDTDDLDTPEHKTTIAENNLENGAITPPSSSPADLNDDSDYLSVVPIEEERIEEKESLKKDYGSELNDISDSPKKSDRRTLDETKFDSVNDNEA